MPSVELKRWFSLVLARKSSGEEVAISRRQTKRAGHAE
jgi:hypothetical protein